MNSPSLSVAEVLDREPPSFLHRTMALLVLIGASASFVAMVIWPLVANRG